MKIIVSVIVYNRLENLKRWIKCWKESKPNAELVIIHTGPENWEEHCPGATYIKRKNQGFDIGCFQDVCRGRLAGFPEWDYLLWCADDTMPMTKDFVSPFTRAFENPSVGVSCMQISSSVSPHVRTTGFCIKKGVAAHLKFPKDPVTTKQECYLFEHRGGQSTLTNQIRNMGLNCVMVSNAETSPLWDTGYWKRLDRIEEHYKVFPLDNPLTDKVTFICTIFNTYPQIISSLILQTHENWELILIHDGPNETGLKSHITDNRIKYIETKERVGNWGHSLRAWAINEFELGEYLVISNADNYYTPVFLEYMLKGFKKSHTAVATYCEKMIHSYKAWDVISTKLEKGYLDCGGVVVKSAIAKEVGWNDVSEHSADWLYFADIATKYSWRNFISVKGCLFVHN
jgi:hypothetical protein